MLFLLFRFEVLTDALCIKTVPAFMNTVGITSAMVTGDTMPFINFRVRRKLHVTCYMLHVTRYMLQVTCYMLQVTWYMLHVTCYMLHVSSYW